MKTIRFLILTAIALLFVGCASYKLPAVNAESFEYRRTDPIGGTHVSATNVAVTDKEVKADSATWTTTYPSFSVSVSIKGYKRERDEKEKQPPVAQDK